MISIDGLIIGKPRDKEDAFETLKRYSIRAPIRNLAAGFRLSGREHFVYSGVAIIDSNERLEKFHEETIVEFGHLPENLIRNYVETGEPL